MALTMYNISLYLYIVSFNFSRCPSIFQDVLQKRAECPALIFMQVGNYAVCVLPELLGKWFTHQKLPRFDVETEENI